MSERIKYNCAPVEVRIPAKGATMKKLLSLTLFGFSVLYSLIAQTPTAPQQQPQVPPEDVVRITTELVQTNVVVMDKNDHIIFDLKPEDFEVYDNGRKQELKFIEFISTEAPPADTAKGTAKIAPGVDASVARDLSARDVRRVIAFVVDD